MCDRSGVFLAGFLVGAVVSLIVAGVSIYGDVKSMGIKYGIAHYDSRTGDLVWNEPPINPPETDNN